jgi:predicted lipid-binding transport protein (Tim44 family)
LFDRLKVQLDDNRMREAIHIDDIEDARILDARVHGKTAVIDVEFTSQEREGKSAARTVKRIWVLARPLASEDPNWELQDIKTTVDA